ncbi:expressed unknown protein [Seminavis robusta]|uniref:Uncharacterized protein n=1 Tax=Seminavis robusta TaxID=568900 RepID=A0A9N8EMU5_9STRA|nr:expressed unknown protein [Seminavis robusta]|eukprot:Sro1241_g255371.1  (113) ;mRNA; f:1654-1992
MKITKMQLLLLLTALLNSYSSASECTDCVGRGCVYCKHDDFFGGASGPSLCACAEDGFKGCSEFTFGASELKSRPDCTFGSQQGEIIAAVVAIACLFVATGIGICIYMRRRR